MRRGMKKITPFALRVYRAVSAIPLGQTRSYKWVALKIGRPGACRAVGQALKNNPFPLVIPCHRVIKSCGGLGGYSRGSRKKKMLLDLERQVRDSML